MSLFTSRSEFDLEKRVQFTNEIPPYDMFDSLNSVIQTDLWKWVLGYTRVDFGLPYTIDVQKLNDDGTYSIVQDRETGIDNGEVYYKMVNGTVVEDVQYGPSSSSGETYHILEEYGVLLPEFDYLLHEVYRYLGSVYPDHPDLIELLTDNEFDDMISNAGAVIDYEPDNKFFDKVATSLGISSDDVNIEAAMLKIRNLKNEGFRKRIYGSKMGYRMLANDIFQNATVFPVATYLPIKPVDKDLYKNTLGTYVYKEYDESIDDKGNIIKNYTGVELSQREYNNVTSTSHKYEQVPISPITDADALKTWNDTTNHSFEKERYVNYIRQNNRIIDTYSKYYYKKFRLIDYDGSSSSYPVPEDKNIYTYGYSIPFHELNVYEYPPCSDASSRIKDSGYASTISFKDYESKITYIDSIGTDIPLKVINYDYLDSYGNNVQVVESVGEEIHNIKTSIVNYVPYKTVYTYPMIKENVSSDEYSAILNNNLDFFSRTTAKNLGLYNFLNYYYSTYAGRGFTKENLKNYVGELKVIYNPLIKGTLLLQPSTSISFYPHSVSINSDEINGTSAFAFSNTDVVWDKLNRFDYIACEDLRDEDTTTIKSTLQITNFTKGYVDISIDTSLASQYSQIFDVSNGQYVDDRYAIVIENLDGNLVVLEGKMTVETILSGGRYQVTSEHFDIAAIPREKTDQMLSLLYDDYNNVMFELASHTTIETTIDGNGVETSRMVYPETYSTKDYVDTAVYNIGYDEQLARNYYSDDDTVYENAKAQILASDLDYTEFLKYVKKLIGFEETLAAWKLNDTYLYKTTSYSLDGEDIPTEVSLVRSGCTIKCIMRGSKSLLQNQVSETILKTFVDENGGTYTEEVFNESSYQNYVSYTVLNELTSGFITGEISDLSLGNLNVITIYGNGSSGQYIPDVNEVIESSITVKSESGETCNFNYLTADKNIIEHDYKALADYANVEHTVVNYYEQSISNIDDTLTSYTSGQINSEYTNITISPIERETIQIESVIDVTQEGHENIISFESDVAREAFKSLSVGDIITGPSIDSDDNDVFITKVGDNEVTTNVKLQQSGTFVLNYDVKTNVYPSDVSDNLVQYKEDLYNNNLYSVTNPFEHGLWPSSDFPNVSTAVLDSLPDISFYDVHNFRNGENNSFTKILEDTHWDEYSELLETNADKYLIPSYIKFNNELFLELNLNKLIYYSSKSSSTSPILMSVDWLDYLENSLMYSSRATDNVNVGVNLMMETDTTGYYTMLEGQQYTDPQIRLKFITLNLDGQNMWPEKGLTDNDWVTPCYAQVGTGGSGRRRWFKSPEDITYPEVWGVSVYDNVKPESDYDENSDLYMANGELRNVSVWGQDQSDYSTRINSTKYSSVEEPLFEIPLGEYDTVTKYVNNDYTGVNNLLSITQASFYAQTFTNLLKYFDNENSNLKIIGSDISSNNILTSYGIDSTRIFTYAGNWIPTRETYYDPDTNEATNYFKIIYPSNPTNLTYYVVPEETNLSNIVILKDDKVVGYESRTFNRSDVLFYKDGKFYLKSFQYMGLLGDGFDTISPEYDVDGKLAAYKRTNITPETNQAVSDLASAGCRYLKDNDGNYITENGSKVSETYRCSLVERLLQYYLRAASLKGATYNTNVVPNLSFKNYYYSEEGSSGYNLYDALSEFGAVSPIHNDHILYWIYAGSFTPDETISKGLFVGTKNRKWLTEGKYTYGIDKVPSLDELIGENYEPTFNVGDRLALVSFVDGYAEGEEPKDSNDVYKECENESQWYVFKVNTATLLGATLPISKWRYVLDSELSVITDSCETISDDAKCGINTLLDEKCSSIKLPRGYINEGSYNFNITVDPHFLSQGYLYKDDNSTIDKSKEVTFCTTKGAVYYDDDNDAFYTYSNIKNADGELSDESFKVALKFNEQKFFKNTLKIPCIYQLKNTLMEGATEEVKTPVVSSITGLDFPVDKLATGDRILEVKTLDLRSVYSTSLEPVFFSNYYTINYPIKGVTENNELYLSYVPSNPTAVIERLNFTTNIMNLLPVNSIFDEDTKTYSTELATDDTTITFGDTFKSPELSNIKITKSLSEDSYTEKSEATFVNREFGYFKNNLIVRGKINTSTPKVILTPSLDGGMFQNAVTKISIGDSLVGAYALEPTGNEEKYPIQISVDGNVVNNAVIQYAYFANNQFRAVEKDGTVYYNDNIDVASVVTNIDCKKAEIVDNQENTKYLEPNKTISNYVKMVGWTKDLGWYVEIMLENDTSVICSMEIDTTGKVILSQAYMSNGKHVYVDLADGNHTLVGHTLGEYDSDYLTPRTLTIRYNGKTEGLQIMSDQTDVTVDTNGNTVWKTKIYDGDNLSYTVNTVIKNAEEFVKAIITDTDSQEEIKNSFDGNFATSITYNIEKIDSDGNTMLYVIHDTSTTSGTVIVPTKGTNGVYSYKSYSAVINTFEGASVWKEYTYGNSIETEPSSTTYTYEKSDSLLTKLDENGIITGIGKTYTSEDDVVTESDIKVLYRDISLSNAKLTQSESDSNLYTVDYDFVSEPYFTDTAMTVNPNGTKNPISITLKSRAVLKKDNSGKYTVYAKGRSLFIKSPTSILVEDTTGENPFNNGYMYNGDVTPDSYWKLAYAPIFNEKMFLSIRSTLVNDKEGVDSLVEMSMMRFLELLGHQVNLDSGNNAGITVDGRAMSIDYDNTLLSNFRAVIKAISGYKGVYDSENIYFDNVVTYNNVKSAMDYAKSNKTSLVSSSTWVKADGKNTTTKSVDGFPLLIQYSGTTWTFRCYGFKLIEETVTDGQSVIGASKQTFAEIAPTVNDIKNYYTEYILDDNGPIINYEHAYAMFAYYYTYYLCGNAENTSIISSSNISDIQFTDNSMLVTDVKGNINSIGLCYLHNREDIENPENWSASEFPMELTCYSVERNVVGVANYKIGSNYVAIPRPEVIAKQNLFDVKCSYANDEIILLGGYIYSKTEIGNIYDDFYRGDKTDTEYQDWKDNRSDDEKAVETELLSQSKFDNVGIPVLLYSTDKGSSFEVTTLKSTSGMSFEWEGTTEPSSTEYISSVIYANNEYKIFVKKVGSTVLSNGETVDDDTDYYYYIEASEDDGSFDFSTTTGTREMDEYKDISQAHEFDLDAQTGTEDMEPSSTSNFTSSINSIPTGYYRMMFTEGQNVFYILTTKGIRFGEDVTVSSKTSGSLTLSSALVSSGDSSFDVLLAFKTKENISDSLGYLNMERAQKYVNEPGDLRVPETTEVDSSSNANRFYSYRETLQPENLNPESDTYDPYGYPSVAEDSEHSLYEYNTTYNVETGDTEYLPKEMTNDYGETIYLCDSTGRYYFYVDKETMYKTLGTLEMRGSYPLSAFETAKVPLYETLEEAEVNPSVRANDDTFRSLLDLDNSCIISLCYDSETPFVKVSTKNTNLIKDVQEYLFTAGTRINGKSSFIDYGDTENFVNYLISTTDYLPSDSTQFLDSNGNTSISLINDAINNITYEDGTDDNGEPNVVSRFVRINVYSTNETVISTDANGNETEENVIVDHYFWYDNLAQEYILKNKRYLSALAYVPYNFMAGITAYKNVGFPTVDGSGGTNLENPITGVYLSNYGYGGSRDNNDLWENTLPWINDPDAFDTDDYLRNTNGENVYLVDESGTVIESYNSEISRKVGDTFELSSDLLDGLYTKDIKVYSNSSNVFTQSVYLNKSGTVQTYTPVSSLTLGTTPFEIDLWAFKSVGLVDIDTKKVDGKDVPNISIRYYGRTDKNTYKEVPCNVDNNLLGQDFKYDLKTKRLCYLGSNVLQSSFFVSSTNEVDVSKLNVYFYVDGEQYTVSYNLNLNMTQDDIVVDRSSGVAVRTFKLSGESSYSIYFDSYAVYQPNGSVYRIVNHSFYDGSDYENEIYSYSNKSNLALSICKPSSDGSYEKVDMELISINQNCLLSSQYNSNGFNIDAYYESDGKKVWSMGNLTLNLIPTVSTVSDYVKVRYDNIINTITLPLFILGDVNVYSNYVVDTVNYWKHVLYVDDIDISTLAKVEYTNGKVYVSDIDALDGILEYEISSYTENTLDIFTDTTYSSSGYFLSFKDGIVFDKTRNLNKLRVSIVKVDPEGDLSDYVFTNGCKGKIACRLPKYDTFKGLIDDKGYIIDKVSNDNLLLSYSDGDTVSYSMASDDNTSFNLNEPLNIDGFNDGAEHYILMKWLTQSTIRTEIKNCSDTNTFVELNLTDKAKFTPDRVWFNPDGYPTPPVSIGNTIFNISNNEYYSSDSYKNNNGYSIYRCNESGCLVGYSKISNLSTIKEFDIDNDGLPENVEGYIKTNGTITAVAKEYVLDPYDNVLADAQIPIQPTYDSCQDWFKNEFYIKGHESNPYWQVLNVTSKFDSILKKWVQKMTVNEYVRSTQEMSIKEIDSDDAYVVPLNATSFSVNGSNYVINSKTDVLNKKEGTISFILDKPSDKYQTESQFIKYGITAQNPFYGDDIWSGQNKGLAFYLDSTYTVCSTENLADLKDHESEIQEITEFGLFNKDHQLIAYAVFPPIEYRTNTQHVSFTCYVKQGSLVAPENIVGLAKNN